MDPVKISFAVALCKEGEQHGYLARDFDLLIVELLDVEHAGELGGVDSIQSTLKVTVLIWS